MDVTEPILPAKLGHVFKVHSIQPRKKLSGHEHAGDERQYVQDLVHAVVLGGAVEADQPLHGGKNLIHLAAGAETKY